MPRPAAQVTAAEISRLAGVTRATVSNWRRRHADFPAPSGGTETSPTYDLEAVRAWLAARGQLPAASAADELRVALRVRPLDDSAPGRFLTLVLAADRLGAKETKHLLETPDNKFPQRAREIVRPYLDQVPGVDDATYRPEEVHLLRSLLRCVRDDGAVRAADVLAERDLEDTSSAGAYETPEPLADLMADLLAPADGAYPARVFDPACGTGELLAAAARRGSGELYGQDVLVTRAAQAAVRLGVLAPKAVVRVCAGDSLRADSFPALTADAALCAPPYGDRDWGHEELAYDPRWLHGLPPKGEPELAWVQHCLAHVAEGAPVLLLLPPATAERAAGRRIRGDLVRTGTLCAVIALPAGAATPLHVGLHLWLLRRPDPRSPAPQTVLFVDTVAADQRTATATRPGLDWAAMRETVSRAWSAFRADGDGFEAVPGIARAVPAIDLLDGAVDLTPARHVRVTPVSVRPDQFARTAQQVRTRLHRAATELAALSNGAGWPSTGGEPRTWRSTTVADLLRGGALTLLRSPASSRGGTPQPRGATADPTPTLTVEDIAARRPASGPPDEAGKAIEIREGDVILPELLRGGPRTARVATADDAGYHLGPGLHLLRPDPQRLDPWFLAGFLSDEDNVNAAATGASIIRIDARRLRVPLLPLTEQQRYGEAFRQLHTLRLAADHAHRLAEETVRILGSGLTTGVLMPPATCPQST